MKLDEFFSPYITDVWKFLDELRQSPETFKALPEPDRTPRSIQIARDFNEHIQKVMNFEGSREERLKWEWEDYKRLDKKYPNLNVLSQVEHEPRFSGVK